MKTALAVIALAGVATLASCSGNKDMNTNKPTPRNGMRTLSIENVVKPKHYVESGSFKGLGDMKGGAPLILPDQKVEIKFKAAKGQALMFATMYGASKDWFFASQQPGITLYTKDGKAITGDVSSEVKLWDNGTKDNMNGNPESKMIMEVPNVKASDLMKLTLAYTEETSEFTLTITNSSKGTAHETPFSPGVWAVSNFDGMKLLAPTPFFMPGKKTNDEITALATMGDISKLEKTLKANTGIITGLSPVLVVVYRGTKNPIFTLGQKDAKLGLKEFSQMGDAKKLMASLKKMAGVKSVFLVGNAPLAPGKSAMAQYKPEQGDMLAYATMFGFSNDWFYANEKAVSATMVGDLTKATMLYDSGTGVDQYPGAGNRQALFGGTPQMEDKVIMKVGNMFPIPPVEEVLKITIR